MDPFRVVTEDDEHLGGGVGADAEPFAQFRCGRRPSHWRIGGPITLAGAQWPAVMRDARWGAAEAGAGVPPTRALVEACSMMSSVSPFTIHLSPPDIRGAEREAIVAAIDSGWAAPAGPDLEAFEVELAERCGVTHAVALSSGTAALHLALHASGIVSGDVVLMSTFTFVATYNAVAYTGANPVLVDASETRGASTRTWFSRSWSGVTASAGCPRR